MFMSKETKVVPCIYVTMGPMETLKTKRGLFPGPQIPEGGHYGEEGGTLH